MKKIDYNSPSELKNFLEENGMAMQKKFGQNFMTNPASRKKIADYLQIEKGETVFEIGPGLGCMTAEILSAGGKATVFEIDRGFVSVLHEIFSDEEKEGNFKIVQGDVLKTWKGEFFSSAEKPEKLAGNLPYNIAATFIGDTITENVIFDKCVFTVQREVAQRMASKPGSGDYSAFSVLCQWKYDVKAGLVLGSGNFWPKPNVASQAVILQKKERNDECNPKIFVSLVHALFSSRRKTVLNNIKPLLQNEDAGEFFLRCGISKNERAENLSSSDFVRMAAALGEMKG